MLLAAVRNQMPQSLMKNVFIFIFIFINGEYICMRVFGRKQTSYHGREKLIHEKKTFATIIVALSLQTMKTNCLQKSMFFRMQKNKELNERSYLYYLLFDGVTVHALSPSPSPSISPPCMVAFMGMFFGRIIVFLKLQPVCC